MSERYLTAILTADWHLSHIPPICRSREDHWYSVQGDYIHQIKCLCDDKIPVILAGDIFHKWNSPVELVNFAIGAFQGIKIYSIPGQHDLPNHRYEDLYRSGYWTLMQAKVINHVFGQNNQIKDSNIRLHGFPFGEVVRPLKDPHDLCQEIAIVHEYLWTKDTGYVGAPKESRLKNKWDDFKGYDVVVVGDNHKPFIYERNNQVIVNCGSLMRRDITQKDYKPCVWKLYSDNSVEEHFLDISKDNFLEGDKVQDKLNQTKIANMKVGEFMDTLKDIRDISIDFEESVRRFLRKEKVHPEVERIIISALEESNM